ncbi:hypothetical protein BY996DRAFT_6410411 [Phakopsora pachyrhizi]|nr:hypothetical protein BY996DRAFT_6410411 [Phakopsora pachyrhizi]
MSNHSFSPVNDSEFDNLNSEQTHEQDDNSNGTFENLDPELEQFECMKKINFKFLLYESTNSSEARFYEVIRTVEDVYIIGYVSNDPELQKNWQFVLKDKDSFEKWKLSVAKHPKAEIGVKILTPNPKERLENQKKIDLVCSIESITSDSISGLSLSQSSMMVGLF